MPHQECVVTIFKLMALTDFNQSVSNKGI